MSGLDRYPPVATALGGCIAGQQGQSNQPKQRLLDHELSRVRDLIAHADVTFDQLREVADRVVGMPNTNATPQPPPDNRPCNGQFDELGVLHEQLHARLIYLRTVASRLAEI